MSEDDKQVEEAVERFQGIVAKHLREFEDAKNLEAAVERLRGIVARRPSEFELMLRELAWLIFMHADGNLDAIEQDLGIILRKGRVVLSEDAKKLEEAVERLRGIVMKRPSERLLEDLGWLIAVRACGDLDTIDEDLDIILSPSERAILSRGEESATPLDPVDLVDELEFRLDAKLRPILEEES